MSLIYQIAKLRSEGWLEERRGHEWRMVQRAKRRATQWRETAALAALEAMLFERPRQPKREA